jgi:hypothetical protein
MGWRGWFVSSGQAESGLRDALVLESGHLLRDGGPAMRREVKTERMVTDEMVLIVSPNHAWAAQGWGDCGVGVGKGVAVAAGAADGGSLSDRDRDHAHWSAVVGAGCDAVNRRGEPVALGDPCGMDCFVGTVAGFEYPQWTGSAEE